MSGTSSVSHSSAREQRTREQRRAHRLGRLSVEDRDADCPYEEGSDLADAWYEGRNDAEVEMGEEYADFCDPSMRDCYE